MFAIPLILAYLVAKFAYVGQGPHQTHVAAVVFEGTPDTHVGINSMEVDVVGERNGQNVVKIFERRMTTGRTRQLTKDGDGRHLADDVDE